MLDPHLAPPDEGADFRRRMVEEALLSRRLRNAIELALRASRRNARWNELLAEAEEVTNEVALRALDRLESFDPSRAAPMPWLMGIAVNVLRERARWGMREAKRSVPQSSLPEGQWEEIVARLRVEPGDAQWDAGPVWEALGELTAAQQRILRLRFVEGRPHAEIALSLGISEGASRVQACHALRALRRKLPSGGQP